METSACPKCGGPVPAGQDQCPHCQIYLSKYYMAQERRAGGETMPSDPAERGGGQPGKKINTRAVGVVAGTFCSRLPRKAAVPEGFPVARLTVKSSGATETGPWQTSGAAVPKDRITMMVAASWCPYCEEHIAAMGKNPREAAKVDMILFYEDELERELKKQFDDGRIPDDAWQQFTSKVLANPEKLAPYNLPYYIIKPGQFGSLVNGYPTFLSCDSDGCKEIDEP